MALHLLDPQFRAEYEFGKVNAGRKEIRLAVRQSAELRDLFALRSAIDDGIVQVDRSALHALIPEFDRIGVLTEPANRGRNRQDTRQAVSFMASVLLGHRHELAAVVVKAQQRE